jgi:hypothetical protein
LPDHARADLRKWYRRKKPRVNQSLEHLQKEKIRIAQFSPNEMFGAAGSAIGGLLIRSRRKTCVNMPRVSGRRYRLPKNAVPERTGFSAVRSQRQRPFSVF